LFRHVRFPEPFSKPDEAPRNMRKAPGQCGANSTRVPGPALSRRCEAHPARGARAWVQVTLFGRDSPDGLSTPAMARAGSDCHFSGLPIVMGCPWHDIRINTGAGGHRGNISSELPASVSKWAKSYNLSRSLPPTGQPFLFEKPGRSTRAYSRRRSPVSRQSKMTIRRPDFFSRKPFLQA
jgi:hypothetical protein